jgi:hypothetical protein
MVPFRAREAYPGEFSAIPSSTPIEVDVLDIGTGIDQNGVAGRGGTGQNPFAVTERPSACHPRVQQTLPATMRICNPDCSPFAMQS